MADQPHQSLSMADAATTITVAVATSEEETCCICLEAIFSDAEEVLRLPCNHRIHLKCANGLSAHGYTECPLCRGPMSTVLKVVSDSVHNVHAAMPNAVSTVAAMAFAAESTDTDRRRTESIPVRRQPPVLAQYDGDNNGCGGCVYALLFWINVVVCCAGSAAEFDQMHLGAHWTFHAFILWIHVVLFGAMLVVRFVLQWWVVCVPDEQAEGAILFMIAYKVWECSLAVGIIVTMARVWYADPEHTIMIYHKFWHECSGQCSSNREWVCVLSDTVVRTFSLVLMVCYIMVGTAILVSLLVLLYGFVKTSISNCVNNCRKMIKT